MVRKMSEYLFKNPYFSQLAKVNFIQRVVIIHSILYYEYDATIKNDKWFDDIARQLVKETYWLDEPERSMYYYCMYDFDGVTGFHIIDRLNEQDREYLTHLAFVCLKRSKSNA